jgi:hypothetical protein
MSNPLKRRKVYRSQLAAADKVAAPGVVAQGPAVKKAAPVAPEVAPEAPRGQEPVKKKGLLKW